MRQLKKELWPHKVVINVDYSNRKNDDIEKWLSNIYGVFKDRWNVVYQHNQTDYYFRQGTDAAMFALKWS